MVVPMVVVPLRCAFCRCCRRACHCEEGEVLVLVLVLVVPLCCACCSCCYAQALSVVGTSPR
jgi:hypothetical protein